MDEIPADVLAEAQFHYDEAAMDGDTDWVRTIARAILAERERAAKLAESYEQECGPLMAGLADKIRRPTSSAG